MAKRLPPARLRALTGQLWPYGTVGPEEEGPKTYMLLDAARHAAIYPALEAHQDEVPVVSLYQGELAENLADVSPYLVAMPPGAPFAEWLIDQGWGDAWGLFVHSPLDLDEVRRHFRRFNIVNTEDGRSLLFRFYDPRVLRVFLPTCDGAQLAQLFRGITGYWMEDESGAGLHRFDLIDGTLRATRHALEG